MRAHFSLVLTALAFASATVSAQAADLSDYRVGNEAWNGLSSFETLVTWVGAEAREVTTIDLAAIGEGDVLAVFHPSGSDQMPALRDWVQSGGRLLLADDFGDGDALAADFGLRRVTPPGALQTMLGNPALALLNPLGRHELTTDVLAIATNHPSAYSGEGRAVVGWSDGVGLVYDMLLGEGRAVFVSDPSIFTNLMLPLRDNAALARNTLRALCGDRVGCIVWIATGEIAVVDAPAQRAPSFRPHDAADTLRTVLGDLQALRIRDDALHLAALLLAIGASVLVVTVFPFRPTPRPRPVETAGSTEFEASLRRFSGRAGDQTWDQPAAMLREAIEPVLWAGLGLEIPSDAGEGAFAGAAEKYVAQFEPALRGSKRSARRREVERALRRLASLPRRQALLIGVPEHIAERDVRRMYNTLLSMIQTMGLDDQYRKNLSRPS